MRKYNLHFVQERNVRQFIQVHRGEHSEKPLIVIDGITKMFPEQEKRTKTIITAFIA